MNGLQPLYSDKAPAGVLPVPMQSPASDAAMAAMPASREGFRVSEAEFWKTWYYDPDYRYEWNNGILEVIPVSDYQGYQIGQWFIGLLHAFLESHPIARTVGMDIGFRLAFADHVSIRKPDYAVILNTNPTDIEDLDASFKGTYDMCLEILSYSSPSEVRRDTVQKKFEYAGTGVQEYYILDPRGVETAFYRLGRDHTYHPLPSEAEDIIQSGVLPGFQFRHGDLYSRPSLKHLIHDAVYQHYVLLDYQQAVRQAGQEKERARREKQRARQEKQRAEQEKQRAEQIEAMLALERQRAEQERRRAEKLAARLRALGLSLEE